MKKPISTGIFRANFKSTCDAFIVLVGKNTTWLKNMQSSASSSIVVDISTLSEPVVALKFGIEHFTSGANVDYEVGYQLTKGSELSSYVPHKEQTFIFPLGNEKLMLGDYLADDGIHHVRKQITLTGNETITINNVGESNQYFKVILQDKSYVDNNIVPNALSNYYIAIQNSTNYFSDGKFTISSSGDLVICDTVHTSVQDFQNFLSNNSIIFQYVLAEEVIVPYTSAQQEVYNQIKQALSYEEQTNISSNTIALFSVEAYLDSKEVIDEKYTKPSTGIPKTDLASAVQTSLNKADSAIQEHQDISGKQDITDNTLTTINKTVPTAINEVNSIAKLANQAKSYSTYQAFINYLNTAEKTEFIPGQSFMIQTKLVPDLWVYSVENTSVQYTYTTDEDFITYTNQATGGQVGYYKLAQLETQKVDLTDYATKTYVNNLFNSIVDGDEVSY